MKKMLQCIVALSFCVLFLSGRVEAQPQQGQFMVGGGVSVSYRYTDAFFYSLPSSSYNYFSSDFSVSIGPSLGYFVSNNVVLGCQIIPSFYTNSISISYSSSFSSRSSGLNSYLSIAISPFVRYFFPEIGAKIYPFATVGLGFQPPPLQVFYRGNVGIPLPLASYSGTIGAGLAWFFNPNISIEPIISYNLTWGILGEQITQKSGRLGLGVGWQIYLRSLAPEGGN